MKHETAFLVAYHKHHIDRWVRPAGRDSGLQNYFMLLTQKGVFHNLTN